MADKRTKRTPRRDELSAQAAERAQKALVLRRKRMTYDQIAKEIGVANRGVAARIVAKAIADIPKEDAKETLALELEWLDSACRAIETKCMNGDLRAIEVRKGLMDRRSKYLGLDKPTKTEIAGPDGGPIETSTVTYEVLSDRIARIVAAKSAAGGTPGDEP